MAPKKAAAAAAPKKGAAAPTHASYKDMIKDAILALKDRNGSSRIAIKKYIQANNKTPSVSGPSFDSQFNKALRSGVEKGEFAQPKGPSGTVKLAKKDAVKPAATKKAVAPKPEKAAKPSTKKAAPKKTSTKAAAVPKKTTTTKKAAKPKANTSSKRKTPAAAPAIVPTEKVLSKTKSGRVTKGPAKPAAKKATPKKAAAKKTTTPKKKADAPAAS